MADAGRTVFCATCKYACPSSGRFHRTRFDRSRWILLLHPGSSQRRQYFPPARADLRQFALTTASAPRCPPARQHWHKNRRWRQLARLPMRCRYTFVTPHALHDALPFVVCPLTPRPPDLIMNTACRTTVRHAAMASSPRCQPRPGRV